MNAALICRQITELAQEDSRLVPLLSNASALLNAEMNDVNWVGFYTAEEEASRLTLGPFQGKVACVHIPFGKGVCGAAYERGETIVVNDVHHFPGHIACDSASRSEIVVPIKKDSRVAAVLDIDSHLLNRFTGEDKAALEQVVKTLEAVVQFA